MKTPLPKLSAPALRALAGAGITHVEQLTSTTEGELLKLHGFGPSAIPPLRAALKDLGLSFKAAVS
jgi:hypothetical protein